MSVLTRTVLPVLLLGSLLTGCATHSDGTAPLNQRTWPICSVIGGLVGGGLGAIESGAWAAGGAALGILTGGLICYAQDGDQDGDGVFDRRDRCPDTPANTPVEHHGCPRPQYPGGVTEPVVQSEVITLSDAGDVLFATNQSDLTPAAKSQLDALMPRLQGADVVEYQSGRPYRQRRHRCLQSGAFGTSRQQRGGLPVESRAWRRTKSAVKAKAKVSLWLITIPKKGARKTVAWICTSM